VQKNSPSEAIHHQPAPTSAYGEDFSHLFKPAWWNRNCHIQNIMTSLPSRKKKLTKRFQDLISASKTITLDCGHGIKLNGEASIHDEQDRPTLILLHGWEGSSNSGYVLSSAGLAFREGYNVFRLNFRDHNDTHHLNKGIFNSSRIDEVVAAVSQVQSMIPSTQYFLAGYSLGGNFALRVAMKEKHLQQKLSGTVAVCPVIDPKSSTDSLTTSLALYEWYFTYKWKKSLRKKLHHFPEYNYGKTLKQLKSMNEMNTYFIPNFTEYPTLDQYYATYRLSAEQLKQISSPTLVIASEDDAMIPAKDVRHVAQQLCVDGVSSIEFDIQKRGAHCAFLTSFNQASWADHRLLGFFSTC